MFSLHEVDLTYAHYSYLSAVNFYTSSISCTVISTKRMCLSFETKLKLIEAVEKVEKRGKGLS